MAHHHDALFRATFAAAEHAAPLLRWLLPPAIGEAVEWGAVRACATSGAGAGLRLHHADLLFELRLRGLRRAVVALVEHSSRSARPGSRLVRQLHRYVVHVAAAARRPAPFVVPLVVRNGPPLQLPRAAGSPAPAIGALRAFEPRVPFVLDDLAAATPQDIRARGLTPLGTLTLLCLQFLAGRSDGQIAARLGEWADLIRAVADAPGGHERTEQLSSYVLHATDLPAERLADILDGITLHRSNAIMSTADRLRAEGRALGILEGKAEGKAEGNAEGRAAILVRLLAARFGDLPSHVQTRIHCASIADLDVFATRVLSATSLADVFATE